MKLLLLLALAAYAPQHAGTPITPELEAKAHTIGKTIRCAVCQGLSVADSPSPMAQSMMDRVRELVTEGKSEAEIHAYFVERYGEWILLEPKAEGFNLIVWVLPFVFVGLGLAVIARNTAVSEDARQAGPAPEAADDPYLKAVRDRVEKS
ncbi:MAG: cytochrome c-type biogenesis protein CcmH [Deltaproteobacteria bacterium]|nr:cytochrome c-type biogenesis protein CcmH [Deltaproteobacteria bacterium]